MVYVLLSRITQHTTPNLLEIDCHADTGEVGVADLIGCREDK
jgi:hypothetical protein